MYFDDVAEYPLIEDNSKSAHYNLDIWYTRFIEQKELDKVSLNTLKSYRSAMISFLSFVALSGKSVKMDKIGAKFINRYLIEYQKNLALKNKDNRYELLNKESKNQSIGKNDANFTILEEYENSLSHRLTILKMFFLYITENNKDLHDYTKTYSSIAKIKIHDKETDYLTPDEMIKLIDFLRNWRDTYKTYKPKSSQKVAIRDSFLLVLYALTGARSDEVVHIKLKDIAEYQNGNTSYYIISINKSKGGKRRKIAVSKHYIFNYIEELKSEMPHDCYVSSTFNRKTGSYNNNPIHPNKIREFANYIMDLLGFNKKGLHSFRRGYATKRISKDKVDISIVAKELGNTIAILEKHYLKHIPELIALED